ncbi:MAG: helix-turn-helix domain-containing protein [Burkholderiaceae bacterium]|nr:helix-turn-helix domain-containing protein [Burkholderiaceae bacterium]
MTDAEGEILTLDEVAAYLKAGKRTVYRLAQQGDIPAFKLGGTRRFRRTELDRWIAASIEKNQNKVNADAAFQLPASLAKTSEEPPCRDSLI